MLCLTSRPNISLLFAAAASLALLSGCGLFDDDEFITYAVGEVGSRDIVVVRGDGLDERVVVGGPSDDFSPHWSPDRDRIAFLSTRDGNVEIYVSLASGSSQRRITNSGVDESQPTWSPDGKRLAFTSPNGDGKPRVFWVDLSNLRPTRLIFESETDPAWSPEGTWIAFAALDDEGESVGLFLRNPDGVNKLQLSESPDLAPAWSPDSKKLVFVSTRDGNEELYVLKVGKSGPEGQAVRITDNPARDFSPVWSPDSKRVAFISDRNGNRDVFTVSDKGEKLKTVTSNDFEEIDLDWGPDGLIVFESEPTGSSELFVTQEDGTQQRRLSSGVEPASQPDW